MSSETKNYFVYILQCENGKYYTGYTVDIAKRFDEHKNGKKEGAKFTRGFKPEKIAAAWKITGGRGAAMKVECFIKKRDRGAKERFISDPATLREEFKKKAETSVEINIFPESAYVGN